MANNVTNILRIDADEARLREILEAIQQDEFGIGRSTQSRMPSSGP